jgi:hypothetical protein
MDAADQFGEEECLTAGLRRSLETLRDTLQKDPSTSVSEEISQVLKITEGSLTELDSQYHEGLTAAGREGFRKVGRSFRRLLGDVLELTTVVQVNAQVRLRAAQTIVGLSIELQHVDCNDEESLPERCKELQASAIDNLKGGLPRKVRSKDIDALMTASQDLLYNMFSERNKLVSTSRSIESLCPESRLVELCYECISYCGYCCCLHDEMAPSRAGDVSLEKCQRLKERYDGLMQDLNESKASVTLLKHRISHMRASNGEDVLLQYVNVLRMLKEPDVPKVAKDFIRKNEKLIDAASSLEQCCLITFENWSDLSGVRKVARARAKRLSRLAEESVQASLRQVS